MQTKHIIALLVILSQGHLLTLSAQASKTNTYPIVGEYMPHFVLNDVDNHPKKVVTPEDFKGKWLIMDFWAKGCVVCLKNFPKINQLQKEFKDHIQFLLVGRNDNRFNKDIRKIYNKVSARQGLELPIAYDTVLFEQFRIKTVPHVIIIDREGKVYAITSSSEVTKESLKQLVDGKNYKFQRKPNGYEDSPNVRSWKYLIENNRQVENDFLYRSILSKNNGEPSNKAYTISQNATEGYYQAVKMHLSMLYNVAYLGKTNWSLGDTLYRTYSKSPILEVDDTASFLYDYSKNQGFYNYSLSVPKEKANEDYLMKIMQRDLKNYFNYHVDIETRILPYWKLTATETARVKLRTKGEPREIKANYTQVKIVNAPISSLLRIILYYSSLAEYPLIDETGIDGNIDISFNAVMNQLEDIKSDLQKNGLMLEMGWKKMKVLVIKNSQI